MGCTTSKDTSLTQKDRQRQAECETDVSEVLKEMSQINKNLDVAKEQFFVDAQITDMSMSIKQLPILINRANDLNLEASSSDDDNQSVRQQLFDAIKRYASKLYGFQTELQPLIAKGQKGMDDYMQIQSLKKPPSKSYPSNFDRLRCLLVQMRVVAFEIEIPPILRERSTSSSNKLSDLQFQKLNAMFASVINCQAVSVKID